MIHLKQSEIQTEFIHKLFQIVLNISLEETQKKLDKVLKRNLIGQSQALSNPKTSSSELPVNEPISEAEDSLEE